MAKKKRPARKGRVKSPPTPPSDRRQVGLQAFRAGGLDDAIAAWTELAEDDAQVAAALAEAYFRRALMRPAGEEQVADLQRAATIAPNDLRYRYHLGLVMHRIGDLPEALRCYRAVLQRDAAWPGAGVMLALAELERDPRVDLATLPGSTPSVRRDVAPVQALLLNAMLAEGDEPLERFWHGLALLQANEAAGEMLDDVRPLPSRRATAARSYYRGVAAARSDDMQTALQSWQHLQDQHIDIPWLQQNIAAALIGALSLQEDDTGNPGQVALTLHWRSLTATSPALSEALIQTFDRGAQAAAASGDWERAGALWEEAREVLSASAGLGSPRSLLHNLALAYEAQERWLEAAEAWRAMLRTRPRRVASAGETTDASPAGTGELSDAQWAWVRRRVIECYQHAGEPGEAVAIFRQAIKADPEDLEMRLQFADALVANEQEQSAINELQRVLQIEPEYVEAQLRLAGVHIDLGYSYAAEPILRRVLDQHPDRADVKRAMARLLLERGESLHSYGWHERAIDMFEEGQRIAPDEYQFPLNLARIAIELGKPERVRDLLQQVLTLGTDQSFAYVAAIECWAALGEIEEARAVVRQAEAALPLAPGFYIDAGMLLLRASARQLVSAQSARPAIPPSRPDSAVSSLGEELLDRAVALQGNDVRARVGMAQDLLQVRPDLALRYAEDAQRAAPRDGPVLVVLGLAQAMNDRTREARETLRRAAAQARREGDVGLAQDIESLRRQVGTPLLPLLLRTVPLFGDPDDDLFD